MSLRGLLRKLWEESASDVKPTLDLHGLSVKEALEETRNFVKISYRAGLSAVRIVYGKGLGSPAGRGILREVIPAWCEKEGKSWVKRFQREVDLKGGDGSLIIFLKKPQPP
jgi:DNA-nicking Smr family endonuclease